MILDEAGEIHTLHGAADSVLPNLALPYNIHIGGNFATEFGYDFGAELGDVGALLDPEQRYFFLRVGDGFTFDTSLADESGRSKPITLAVPDNESATLVIDPRSQVLYLDGRFNLSQVLRLATLAAVARYRRAAVAGADRPGAAAALAPSASRRSCRPNPDEISSSSAAAWPSKAARWRN